MSYNQTFILKGLIPEDNASLLFLENINEEIVNEVKKFLSYEDKTKEYEYRRLKENQWMVNKIGPKRFQQQLNKLQNEIKVCLLKENLNNKQYPFYTLSGLAQDLDKEFGLRLINKTIYPENKLIPFNKKDPYVLRNYQKAIVDNLTGGNKLYPKAIEASVSAGKSLCMVELAKRFGLKTLIVVPTINIANQMFELFKEMFGAKYVGLFGDGKKQSDKLFVIGIGASLSKVDNKNEHFENLAKTQVLLVDEAHIISTKSLSTICLNLCKSAPYRMFLSGTMTRNDGSSLLLKGITGPNVYEISSQELIKEGFIAKPTFYIVKIDSPSNFDSKKTSDSIKMMREHMLFNENVYKNVKNIIKEKIKVGPILILLDEVEQFNTLLPYLSGFETRFAHSAVGVKAKCLPEKYRKSDPSDLIKEYNKGLFPILVGTDCIGIGSNIMVAKTLILIKAGRSEITFVQSVGRGLRATPDKKEVDIYDFLVENIPMMKFHSETRQTFYKEINDDIRIIDGQ
jgi:superfamily II DNA or RNA helicase